MSTELVPLRVVSPLDGKVVAEIPRTPPAEMEARIRAARAAQVAWAALPIAERVAVLKRCRHAFHARVDKLVEVVRAETGKPLPEILGGEIIANLELFDFYIRHAAKLLAPERVPINPINYPGKRGVIELRPLGVVGVLSSWNYPVALPMRAIVPALAAGNAVAFKPSVDASLIGHELAAVFTETLPKDLLVVGFGGREVSGVVIEHADKINFIGSVSVGKEIAKRCGERLIPCSTELSGKDAAIVLADAPFERTLNGVLWGAFTNTGQNCASIERLYVEDAIYDRFVPALVERVKRLRVGDDVGPLRNDKQMQLVESHVENARATGSKILAGGERVAGTLFFQPTVIEVADRHAMYMIEETFGPTLPVVRVRDAEEAIREANSAKFGLTGSIWTADLPRAETLARRLEVGVATLNNCVFTGALTSAPWGGVKETGHGVTNSKYGLLEMTRPAFVLTDRSQGAKESWWYPYGDELVRLMRAVVAQLGGNVLAVARLALLLPKVLKKQV